jgi:hypothetical protein
VIKHYTLSGSLNPTTVIMEMNRPKVFIAITDIDSIDFDWVVIGCSISQLRFILLMLLLYWRSMGRRFSYTWILTVMNILSRVWGALVYLNVTTTHTILNNVLRCRVPILHISYLSWSLTSALSNPLDSCNNFLIILTSLTSFISSLTFRFVDFKL